jgi:hypothetical protein
MDSDLPVDEQAGRHQRLLAVALEALVADQAGALFAGAKSIPTAFGAAISNGSDQAWVMLDLRDRDPASLLGAVMAWAIRAEVQSLRIITDQESDTLARRAAHFDIEVSVWFRQGRSLRQLSGDPLAPVPAADPRHLGFVDQISASGATVAIEHGIVAGHVRGLEICRVVDDPHGAAQLEVGVGANDRLAFAMLYEGVPVEESLRRVVAEVTAHRTLGAPRHPLNQLAKERFLRWHLEQNPELIGAHELTAVASPVPSRGLSFASPCSAIGRSTQGQTILVVCSVGIDLDLVPYAIDARLCVAGIDAWNQMNQLNQGSGPARLLIAVPSRDLIALQRDLGRRMTRSDHWEPVEFVGLDWVSF